MTWLAGWNYKRSITVSNSSGSILTDFQTLIILDTASLIPKIKSDCGDIRFIDSDESTNLNYWIESGCNTSSTRIWVKIPSIPSGSKTIYLYYGNSSATYDNSLGGTNTFDFYDDFSDGSYSNGPVWTPNDGTWTAVNGYLEKTASFGIYQSISTPFGRDNGVWEWRMKSSVADQNGLCVFYFMASSSSPANGLYGVWNHQWATPDQIYLQDGAGNLILSYNMTGPGQWHSYRLIRSPAGVMNLYFDNTLAGTVTNATYSGSTHMVFRGYDLSSLDDVHYRKYASPEPTATLGGTEETICPCWLTGWNRRKYKTISGSTGGSQTNYQIKLTVYKSTGTDTTDTLYCNNHVRDDFADLRFTISDGSSIIDYWIEEYISGYSATVWIKINSIPAGPGTSTIYVYYNNPTATSLSNGYNTFIFFDDFETGDKGWSNPASNPISTLQYYSPTHSRRIQSATVSKTSIPFPSSFIMNVRVRPEYTGPNLYPISLTKTGAQRFYTLWGYPNTNDISYESPSNIYNVLQTYSINTWYNFEYVYDSIGHSTFPHRVYIDGILRANWFSFYNGNDIPNEYSIQTPTNKAGYIDDLRVRKFVDPEPTFSATGPEEALQTFDILTMAGD